MWRNTLIGTLALLLAAGPALAQDRPAAAAQDKAAEERAAQERAQVEKARRAEEQARLRILEAQRQVEAVQEKLRLELHLNQLAEDQKRAVVDRNQKIADLKIADLDAKMRAKEAAVAQKAAANDWAVEAKIRERFAAGRGGAAAAVAIQRVKVAHCGVGTSEAPAVLTEHLRLARGMGLVVDYVEPQSPAEQSGLKQYDVLVKFDDQKLVNSEQFRILTRLKKPGDDVKMAIVRQGQPMDVVVELGEREVEEPVEVGGGAGGAGAAPGGFGGAAFGFVNDFDVVILEAQGQDAAAQAQVIVPAGGEAIALMNINGRDQAVWSDGQHKLAIDLVDGKPTRLTIRHQDNAAGLGGGPPPDAKPLFEGPIENEKQQQDVPAEFKPKLAKALAALPKPGIPGVVVDLVAPAPVPAPPPGPRVRTAVRRVDGGLVGGGGGRIAIAGDPTAAAAAANRGARVVTSTDKDNLMIARIDGGKISYALVFSQADGKTLFEGPVKTDEQRKALPEIVAKQLETLEKNQRIAPEFGVVGR